tara:strand:- start:130 stop:639 length:510 start_codon:yes stop_codon:yes gene_type:complete
MGLLGPFLFLDEVLRGEGSLSGALEDSIKRVVEGLGYRFWAYEHISQRKVSLLRVYIDSVERSISVDDCANVSRQISSVLDVENELLTEYTLEVSSPGLNRRLFTRAHFKEFEGKAIKVSLIKSYEGRKNYKGLLVGLEGDEVVLQTSDQEQVLFPLEHIDRANLVVNV